MGTNHDSETAPSRGGDLKPVTGFDLASWCAQRELASAPAPAGLRWATSARRGVWARCIAVQRGFWRDLSCWGWCRQCRASFAPPPHPHPRVHI